MPPEATGIAPRASDEGPVRFAEPWHAQVLAIANGLAEAGLFSRSDWAAALGAALRRAEAAGGPDDDTTYYAAALAALEGLVAERSPEAGGSLEGRVEAWRRAYLRTPHGKPVELSAGLEADDADEDVSLRGA